MPRGRPRIKPVSEIPIVPKPIEEPVLADLITYDAIRDLAGSRSFSAGEDYFRLGAVRKVTVSGNTVTASVQGTERYRVTLKANDDELDYRCSCPWYDETEAFCKHCVAVALAYLRGDARLEVGVDDGHRTARRDAKLDVLRIWLESQDPDDLIDLVMEVAMNDENAHDFLSARMDEETF